MMAAVKCRNDDERRARDVLRAVLGCPVECIDPGGGSAPTVDLLMTRADGSRVAVEVTSLVDPGNRSLQRELDKRDWSDLRLAWCWYVHCQSRTDPRALHRQFAVLFESLEQAGVETFSRYRMRTHRLINGKVIDLPPWQVNGQNLEDTPIRPTVEPTLRRLFELGVTAGVRLDRESPGAIRPRPLQAGGAFSAESAADALAEKLAQHDNLAKLRAADAAERHLFLWIHFDGGAASAALRTATGEDGLPDPPRLPDGVDAAWVAGGWTTPSKPEQLTNSLSYIDADGWQHLGPVEAPPYSEDEDD